MKRLFCRYAVLLVCAGCLASCYGPKPAVVRQELQPPAAPDAPYTLVVTIENQNAGAGQAEVIARLRSMSNGETTAQGEQAVALEPHETTQVVFELRPAAPGEYQATVEAHYPPE